MLLLNDHPTYKPPCFLLITCATLTTGTHVAKHGVFLCIAAIFDFIQVTKKYGVTLMNARYCQLR